eukprot:2886517-Karenia_brevis.AAC.1
MDGHDDDDDKMYGGSAQVGLDRCSDLSVWALGDIDGLPPVSETLGSGRAGFMFRSKASICVGLREVLRVPR